jgi:hypothetical protein
VRKVTRQPSALVVLEKVIDLGPNAHGRPSLEAPHHALGAGSQVPNQAQAAGEAEGFRRHLPPVGGAVETHLRHRRSRVPQVPRSDAAHRAAEGAREHRWLPEGDRRGHRGPSQVTQARAAVLEEPAAAPPGPRATTCGRPARGRRRAGLTPDKRRNRGAGRGRRSPPAACNPCGQRLLENDSTPQPDAIHAGEQQPRSPQLHPRPAAGRAKPPCFTYAPALRQPKPSMM